MTTALGILRGNFGRVALLDMDTSLVSHAHHHCHIIMKVSGPDQHFVVEDEVMPVREDTAVLVNTWEEHRYLHQMHDRRTTFLALYIEPVWLAGTDRSFLRCANPAFFDRPGVTITDKIRKLRHDLVERIGSKGYDDPKEAEQIVLDLTTAVARQFADWHSAAAKSDNASNDFRIRRAIKYMHQNDSKALDLDEVANASGLSRPHFNYLFRTCTGVSPGVYYNAVRVEAAVRALSEQRKSIVTLADNLGFSAHSNFTRFFQQHTGIAPRQFQRALAQVS